MENLYSQSSDIFIFYAIAIINLAIDMTDNLLCVFALLVDCNVLSGVWVSVSLDHRHLQDSLYAVEM